MSEDHKDATKAPEFQKVIRHFVTTPHKPHAPIGKGKQSLSRTKEGEATKKERV
jgi:hypothetical protein